MLAYPVGTLLAVIAFVVGAWGFVSDGYSLYQLGLPGWAWQLSGFALFFVAVVLVLFRMHEDRAASSRTAPARSELRLPDEALTPFSPASGSTRSERAKALTVLDRAIISAGQAIANRREDEARRTLPVLRAAILTANKEFRLPSWRVKNAPSTRALLVVLKGYIEEILPLLKLGHDDEARASARAYIERLNAD